ncbi:MAG: glycosyltransferase family 2 protein [Caulobacteraceae bacterium]
MKPLYVCIPVFNGGGIIRRTLKNILDQDIGDFTVIVYDDGSTDRTAENVAKLAESDSRVRLARGGENKGRGAARNALLALAADGMIAWQDADDAWRPAKLREQLAARARLAEARGEDDFVLISTYDKVEEKDGGVVVSRPNVPPETYDLDFVLGPTFKDCAFQLQATMGPASSFIGAGGFDDALNWSEDLDIALKLLRAGYKIVGHPAAEGLAIYNHSLRRARGPVVEASHKVLRDRFRDFAAERGHDIDRIFQMRATGYLTQIYLKNDRFPPALTVNLRALRLVDEADDDQFRRIANNILSIVNRAAAKYIDERDAKLAALNAEAADGAPPNDPPMEEEAGHDGV